MPDRFVSGQETTRFERPVPSEVHTAVTNISDTVNRLEAEFKNQTQLSNEMRNLFNSHMNEQQAKHHQLEEEMSHVKRAGYDYAFVWGPIIYAFLLSWPIRFLNFFFKWYTYTIYKEELYPGSTNFKYLLVIQPVTQFIEADQVRPVNYEDNRKYLKSMIKQSREQFKKHLKDCEKDGWKLRDIINYTICKRYW